MKETLADGRFVMTDAQGRVIVDRPANLADLVRFAFLP